MEQAQACLAGDSAAYERRASGLDDVVVISALRTPMCKVSNSCSKQTTAFIDNSSGTCTTTVDLNRQSVEL